MHGCLDNGSLAASSYLRNANIKTYVEECILGLNKGPAGTRGTSGSSQVQYEYSYCTVGTFVASGAVSPVMSLSL